jgi:hypothetical protein
MALRLTFGGSPCPSLWDFISDTIIDTTNTLIQNQYWDQNHLYDPVSNMIYSTQPFPDSIPFGQATELMVDLPTNDIVLMVIFIDDSIGVSPDLNDNLYE